MADPDTAFPRFFRDKQENGFKSLQAGHPVFDDVEKVEIIIPGQNQSIAHAIVNEGHRQRWPQQYAAFKAGLTPAHDGSPLEEWPPLSPAQVANLKALNIHTVEQLAGVSDGDLSRLGMGSRELRDKAGAWLDNAKGGAAVSEALARAERAEAALVSLKENYDDLAARVETLSQNQPA